MASFFASAVNAIENVGPSVAKDSGARGPTQGWDGCRSWAVFRMEKVSRGDAYAETRVELRPLDDLPTESEFEAESISIVIRARAWMPDDALAAWDRIYGSMSWKSSDFPEGTSYDKVQDTIEQWLIPTWNSAMRNAIERMESLPVIAEQRKDVMDSPWTVATKAEC